MILVLACVGCVAFVIGMVLIWYEKTGKCVEWDTDVRSQKIQRVLRLPPQVWQQLQKDLRRGELERGIKLKVLHLFRIEQDLSRVSAFNRAVQMMTRDPNIKQLYHGTRSYEAVKGIVDQGFRLPPVNHPNMFGPGVYFATVPQKSYDYTGVGGWILVCQVAVGKAKKMRKAHFIDPSKDLKKRRWLFWSEPCDSAHAPAGLCTVSDEHIIFNTDRILPLYLLSVARSF